MTGHVEHLTRAPRVSLWGLSTQFTSHIQALSEVIGGSGDRDHIPDQGVSITMPSFSAPFFGDERNRCDAGLSCSEIGKQARIVVPMRAEYFSVVWE